MEVFPNDLMKYSRIHFHLKMFGMVDNELYTGKRAKNAYNYKRNQRSGAFLNVSETLPMCHSSSLELDKKYLITEFKLVKTKFGERLTVRTKFGERLTATLFFYLLAPPKEFVARNRSIS